MACRKGGTLSITGVYISPLDKIPLGAIVNKGLTIKSGQTHVHFDLAPLLEKIEAGEIDGFKIIDTPPSTVPASTTRCSCDFPSIPRSGGIRPPS